MAPCKNHITLLRIQSSKVFSENLSKNEYLDTTLVSMDRGVRREVLRGFTKSSWGSGGAVTPHASGVWGGLPEDFEINAFHRLRTPVSLSFLSQCCHTKIHADFFIHSHPHPFQRNEVVDNHTL